MQASSQKYIAAFRTHYWDDNVAKIFDSFRENIDPKRFDVVVFADETQGYIQVPEGIWKIAHTEQDSKDLGLVQIPRRVLWRNGDYALYILRHKVTAPGYIISENDLLVRGPKTFQQIADYLDGGGQVVTSLYHEVDARNAYVRSTAQGIYESPAKGYVWMWGANLATADRLYQARLDLPNQIHNELSTHQWPADEVFLGSTIKQLGLDYFNLQDLEGVDTSRLTYRPIYSLSDATIWTGESLTHGVAGQSLVFPRYAISEADFLLRYNNYSYAPGTNLYKLMMLSHLEGDNQTVYNSMIDMIHKSPRNMQRDFVKFALSHHLTYPGQIDYDNLAFLKPVTSSSIWAQSNGMQKAIPFYLVDGNYDLDKYRLNGAGTMPEVEPWLKVDLEAIQAIGTINLYHRDGFFERTKSLKVEVSTDDVHYELIYSDDDVVFQKEPTSKNKAGYVFVKRLQFDKVNARYIKLTRTSGINEIFHLNQIEVYK